MRFLEVDQLVHVVFFRKTRRHLYLVLMHPPLKIVGYPDVHDIVVLVRQQVYVVAMPSENEISPFGRNDSIFVTSFDRQFSRQHSKNYLFLGMHPHDATSAQELVELFPNSVCGEPERIQEFFGGAGAWNPVDGKVCPFVDFPG